MPMECRLSQRRSSGRGGRGRRSSSRRPEPAAHYAGLRVAVFENTVSGITAARDAGVAAIIRVRTGGPIAGEVAVVADLRQAAWDG